MLIRGAWAVLFTLCCGACCDLWDRCELEREDCEQECDERWGRTYQPDAFAYCLVECRNAHTLCESDEDDAYDEATLP